MTVARNAPAKLNLFLHVVGRRPDGLHLLQSLVAFAGIGDRITVESSGGTGFQFQTTGPFASALEGEAADNLVVRAAMGLAALAGRSLDGLRLTLAKNLPVASGIGGGSAKNVPPPAGGTLAACSARAFSASGSMSPKTDLAGSAAAGRRSEQSMGAARRRSPHEGRSARGRRWRAPTAAVTC